MIERLGSSASNILRLHIQSYIISRIVRSDRAHINAGNVSSRFTLGTYVPGRQVNLVEILRENNSLDS